MEYRLESRRTHLPPDTRTSAVTGLFHACKTSSSINDPIDSLSPALSPAATVFLEFWKRRRAELTYDWDLIDWEEEEVRRPVVHHRPREVLLGASCMLMCVFRDQGGAAASVRSQVLAGGASQPHLREARALPALLRQTQPAHGVRVGDLLHGAAL